MVTPVSAMFVLSTILRWPLRGRSKAFVWSSPLRTLWSEITRNREGSLKVGDRDRRSCILVISPRPGRKIRTAPSSRRISLKRGACSISKSVSSMMSKLILVWSIRQSDCRVSFSYFEGSALSASSSHSKSSSSLSSAVTFWLFPPPEETWKVCFCWPQPLAQPRLAKSLSSSQMYPVISITSSSQKASTGNVRPGNEISGTWVPK
mmetsp:Transcript_8205/g.21999  ORF Transcript_8205/g.21999 Transcript_8205/m.21999 type:complete len:206 (-) Transcript_8205:1756-2373(-)